MKWFSLKNKVILSILIFSCMLYAREHGDSDKIFTEIYVTNLWGETESVSGPGSTLARTKKIRSELGWLFKKLKIKSILDAPCGDFNWMKAVNLVPYDYIGLDVVEEIIEKNKQRYGSSKKKFLMGDLILDVLPKVDLIICRDCLVHFPNKTILSALKNFKASGSSYLLTTIFTYTTREVNNDISMGCWRPIDLQRKPFNLPKPLFVINEGTNEDNGAYKDKSLALWDLRKMAL